MNSYTWHINSVNIFPELQGKKDVVVTAKFCVAGTDGQNTATVSGSQDLSLSDSAQFVEYKNLTETQIVGWVKEALGESGQYTLTAEVDSILKQKATPVVLPISIPLPWNLPPESQAQL
jgi:hypothetical protein